MEPATSRLKVEAARECSCASQLQKNACAAGHGHGHGHGHAPTQLLHAETAVGDQKLKLVRDDD